MKAKFWHHKKCVVNTNKLKIKENPLVYDIYDIFPQTPAKVLTQNSFQKGKETFDIEMDIFGKYK